MARIAPELPQNCPTKTTFVMHAGKRYSLNLEEAGWRLRSRTKAGSLDYRTGTTNLRIAEQKAKEWLDERGPSPLSKLKREGHLESLAAIYKDTPKRTKANVAGDNVSRLRTICRTVLGQELKEIPARTIGPDFWQKYQRTILERAGHTFDLATRYRENIAINAAVRAARCLFLPALLRAYRTAGLDVSREAGVAVMLPEPYLPPSKVDDAGLVKAWADLAQTDEALWLVIGLARFSGLRRDEIADCRAGWIEEEKGVISISLRDRPEEKWWTKTGKPYRAQVIDSSLANHLKALHDFEPTDKRLIGDPASGSDRRVWFERAPQKWLRAHGVTGGKPLHRLRGLYADHVARLTSDAVTARLAGIRAAQQNLGHTSSATTEDHYLTPDALR